MYDAAKENGYPVAYKLFEGTVTVMSLLQNFLYQYPLFGWPSLVAIDITDDLLLMSLN